MNISMMNNNELAIDLAKLSKRFGKIQALDGVNLSVPCGTAMALLGENGAGKTTTLRTLVNLERVDSGGGTILGEPLGEDSCEFFQRVGYVSENQKLPSHVTLERIIAYLKPQYPSWDDSFCEQLVRDFELPRDQKIGKMSRGMQMKVALVCAMSYHPELLVLDEPFSGLDPLVREELIDAIIDLMNGSNWTVILSSHDINEVERLCDSVTMIERGRVVLNDSIENLQKRYRRWSFRSGVKEASDLPDEWVSVQRLHADSWSLVETSYDPDHSLARLKKHFGEIHVEESSHLSLRDIYLVHARDSKQKRQRNTEEVTT